MEKKVGEGEMHGPTAHEAQFGIMFSQPRIAHPALRLSLQHIERVLRLDQVLRADDPTGELFREGERIEKLLEMLLDHL